MQQQRGVSNAKIRGSESIFNYMVWGEKKAVTPCSAGSAPLQGLKPNTSMGVEFGEKFVALRLLLS